MFTKNEIPLHGTFQIQQTVSKRRLDDDIL